MNKIEETIHLIKKELGHMYVHHLTCQDAKAMEVHLDDISHKMRDLECLLEESDSRYYVNFSEMKRRFEQAVLEVESKESIISRVVWHLRVALFGTFQKERETEVSFGNYKKDVFGKWWKLFPDGERLASEEVSDVLNYCESTLREKK